MAGVTNGSLRVEILGSQHDRTLFACGVEALDRYLRVQAGQDARKNMAAPFVLVLSDGSLEPFFTRPISIGFASVTILILLLYIPAFKSLVTTITGTVSRQFQRLTSRAA